MTTKAELDRQVAMETGDDIPTTTATTTLFLQKIVAAIASGEELRLRGFGRFRLTRTGGVTPMQYKWKKGPPHNTPGNRNNDDDRQCLRFRVHFSKSETLTRAIREKQHGKKQR